MEAINIWLFFLLYWQSGSIEKLQLWNYFQKNKIKFNASHFENKFSWKKYFVVNDL
jgi:hypothetical protein